MFRSSRSRAISALITVLLAACASPIGERSEALSVCPSEGVIGDPPQFQWTFHPADANNPEPYYSGTLEMGEASFVIGGETLTTRAYRQAGTAYSIPGPTLTMVPGNKYVLRFHNTLPFIGATGEHNVFKDPNVSNVHTHGLHISGESPGDDVSRSFEGGFGGDFVYDVPADHMGGTYWYHAHHHGSTYLQVSGGAFGMIVIDDGNDGIPAPVAAMEERQLVVAYLDPGAAGTGGDTLIQGTLSPTWTVNAVVDGSLCMPSNDWQHFRIALADRNAIPKTLGIGAGCEVALLARDGVWRTTAPKVLTTNDISLTGASRADLAVRCAQDSTITVNGSPVATILVSSTGTSTASPYADGVSQTWQANRPQYLTDLSSVNSVNRETVRMGARTVNGTKFDHNTPTFRLDANQVQEWSVRGAGNHPFHLHVYHMQTSGCGGSYEDGEWYDTIASSCDVRFDLDASRSSVYAGTTIMHCHILEHEDQGAMGWLDVVGGQPAPTFPQDGNVSPYLESYALGAASCGDMVCDPSEEGCGGCPADCGALPTSESSCTDGTDEDCDGVTDCDDPDCDADAACQAAYCGDATCDAGEDSCNCPGDCGTPPSAEAMCTGGGDDDCDGLVDCDDPDCDADAACQPSLCGNGTCDAGEDCTTCADCAGVINGRPSNRFCCGDGTPDGPEGDGTICDGNY